MRFLIIIIALLATNSAHSQDNPSMKLVTFLNVDYINGNVKKKSERHSSEAVIFEAFARAGLPKPIIIDRHFNRAMQNVASGKFDGIFPLFNLKERQDKYTFLKSPVEYTSASLVTMKNNPFIYKGDINELKGMRLGHLSTGSYGHLDEFLASSVVTAIKIPSVNQMPHMLLQGRIDAFLDTTSEVVKAIKLAGATDRMKVHTTPILEMSATLALTKKKKWGDIPSKLDRVLKEMIQDGTFQRLSQQ